MRTHCAKCGRPGPFYASQARACYCIPCHKAAVLARYTQRRTAILAAAVIQRQQRRLQVPPHLRTRRQQKALLDAAAPPGKKICAYCWLPKWPALFPHGKTPDGRDYYCRACRRIKDAQRRWAKRRKMENGK